MVKESREIEVEIKAVLFGANALEDACGRSLRQVCVVKCGSKMGQVKLGDIPAYY